MEFGTAVLIGTGGTFHVSDAEDYGCAGRGHFEAFIVTAGRQMDWADRALYKWKKCVQCATGFDAGMIVPYRYHLADDFCGEFCSLFSVG